MKKKLCLLKSDDMRTYVDDLWDDIDKTGFYPDVIIGILRGGAKIARDFSDITRQSNIYFIRCENYSGVGVPLYEPRITEGIRHDVVKGKRALLVDDTADSGRSLKKCSEYLQGMDPDKMVTATIYVKRESIFKPDYKRLWQKPDEWIIFPGEEEETIVDFVRRWDREPLLDVFEEEYIERVLRNEWKDIESDESRHRDLIYIGDDHEILCKLSGEVIV